MSMQASKSAEGGDVRDLVRERYGKVAGEVAKGAASSCCGSSCATPEGVEDPITRNLYDAAQLTGLPAEALAVSFGCGNPTALAELRAGEIVLDLGSGGGIDVLLSARRVGPTGKAYGLDMTPQMLELARANQAKAGATNVEFLQGTIEAIPLPAASVDVVISNCVINLSGDKPRVFDETFRVLRPGGRLAVSDVVLRRELPPELASSVALWTGCVAGALHEREYVRGLERAGFVDVSVEPTRVFTGEDVAQMARAADCASEPAERAAHTLDGAIVSAFIRARRP